MMNLLRYLFSKKYRINYSKKILNNYNDANDKLEQMYKDVHYTQKVSENLCT